MFSFSAVEITHDPTAALTVLYILSVSEEGIEQTLATLTKVLCGLVYSSKSILTRKYNF